VACVAAKPAVIAAPLAYSAYSSFGQFLVQMGTQAATIWTGMEALKRPNGSHAAG